MRSENTNNNRRGNSGTAYGRKSGNSNYSSQNSWRKNDDGQYTDRDDRYRDDRYNTSGNYSGKNYQNYRNHDNNNYSNNNSGRNANYYDNRNDYYSENSYRRDPGYGDENYGKGRSYENAYDRNQGRNIFERAGDRVRETWNNWTDRNNDRYNNNERDYLPENYRSDRSSYTNTGGDRTGNWNKWDKDSAYYDNDRDYRSEDYRRYDDDRGALARVGERLRDTWNNWSDRYQNNSRSDYNNYSANNRYHPEDRYGSGNYSDRDNRHHKDSNRTRNREIFEEDFMY